MVEQWLILLYLLALLGMSSYGVIGLITILFFWRYRHERQPLPELADALLPTVTVQLPVYNERYVIDRLIRSAANLDYPAHKLELQIIDDSSDDTTHRAAQIVDELQAKGINIKLLHRTKRIDYKAGALAAGLAQATGELIAVFDADFIPTRQFLRQTVPHFHDEPLLGAVQARWSHINGNDSALCRAQAIALDKHFVVDQAVRHTANLFPKFNGSAGVWRRSCIEQVGGWSGETVCEDLDLSTRAVLSGWRMRFLTDVTVGAELPATVAAFKLQQGRWALGSVQCLLKFGREIATSRNQSAIARLFALLTMAAYLTNPLLLLLLALQIPLLLLELTLPGWLWILSLAALAHPLLFVWAQGALHRDWRQRIRDLPLLILVMTGLTVSQSRALFAGLVRRRSAFKRTPKGEGQWLAYRLPFDPIIYFEALTALYALLAALLALHSGRYSLLPLPLLNLSGIVVVTLLEMRGNRQPQATNVAEAQVISG